MKTGGNAGHSYNRRLVVRDVYSINISLQELPLLTNGISIGSPGRAALRCNGKTSLFQNQLQPALFFIHTTSVNARGPGRKAYKVESKGITSANNGAQIAEEYADKHFSRFANPPPFRLRCSTFFSNWLTEVGDIVPVTHSKIPNIVDGVRGITSERMEVVNQSIDWKRGLVNFELWATGFSKQTYATISPYAEIVSGTSSTVFHVNVDEGEGFKAGYFVDIYYPNMVAIATNMEIASIVTGGIADESGDLIEDESGEAIYDEFGNSIITLTEPLPSTPEPGWIMEFAAHETQTDEQRKWWSLCEEDLRADYQEGYLRRSSNLILYGNMEEDAGWSDHGSPTTNERSSEEAYANVYSRKVVADEDGDGIESSTFTSIKNDIYVCSFCIKPIDSTTIEVVHYLGDGTTTSESAETYLVKGDDIYPNTVEDLSANAWTQVVTAYKDTVGGSGAYIAIRSYGASYPQTFYIDCVDVFRASEAHLLVP